MGWRDVTRQAQDRLVTGEVLEFEQWRAVMAAVAPVAGEDPAVSAVVGMAAGSPSFAGMQARPSDPLIAAAVEAADGGWDEQCRLAVTAVTHLALRSALDERQDQILGGAERELLPYREPTRLEAALRGWRDQIAVTEVGPHEAVSIAAAQARLLREAQGWISQVEAAPGMELGELREVVTDASQAWQLASATWRDVARAQPMSPPAVAELSRAWAGVTAAVRSEPSPARRVEALIETGFGGCLQAGLSVRAPGEAETLLTQVGVAVELAADPWHGQPLQDAIPAPRPEPVRPAARSVAQPPMSPGRVQQAQLRRGVDVDPEVESVHANHVTAVRAWRAGVIAQAALEGDLVAVRAARGASRQELERLVEHGHRNKAQLIFFTQPIVVAAIQQDLLRRPGAAGDDLRAEVQTYIAEHIGEWDEDRGRLSTWVWHVAQRRAQNLIVRGPASEQAIRQRETPTSTSDLQEHKGVGPGPEQQAMTAWTVAELRRRVDTLPHIKRNVLVARFGLETGKTESRISVGRRLGIPASTVHRIELRALQELRETQQAEVRQSLPDMAVRLREVAPRDLVARLATEREHRAANNERRPLIERIREYAAARHSVPQQKQPQPSRERGLEL